MVDFILNGVICLSANDKDTFLEDFNKFLESKKAIFKGSIRINEFDNAEIIED